MVYALALGLSVSAITALAATVLQQHIDRYTLVHPDSFISYVLNLLFSPPVVLIAGIFSSFSVLIGLKISFLMSLLVLGVAVGKSMFDEYKQRRDIRKNSTTK